jgi:hypothetical protein
MMKIAILNNCKDELLKDKINTELQKLRNYTTIF